MRKLRLLLPVVIAIVFLAVGCANDSSTKTTTQDTLKKDTINRNSENFSNPH
ncbi:MAG: hypothetical protein LH478_01700 [Chitinophagaceae bacterium]|nr:hypothetical protein [Chitinophagaceae bacterium]